MKTKRKKRYPVKGSLLVFTLLELLIAISIIIMLICLLLPALQMAKEKGKQIFCVGNQRQIATATNMYCDDYGFWPGSLYPGYFRGTYWDTCFEFIGPYLDNNCNNSGAWSAKSPYALTDKVMQVVSCPSAKEKDLYGVHTVQYYCSYAMPGSSGNALQWKKPSALFSLKLSWIIYLMESITTEGQVYGYPESYLYEYNNDGKLQSRHTKGMNILFADSHVEWKKKSNLKKEQAWPTTTPGFFPNQ